MEQNFQLGAARLAAYGAAIAFDVLFPLVVALFVRRRLGVGWRFFAYGALIFFLFQMISRVPLVTVAQTIIGPMLQGSLGLQLAWVAALSLSAGVFEETGRYVGYRWLMRRDDKTWAQGVMYGVGHAGLESALLVGGLTALTVVNLLLLPSVMGSLPDEQRELVRQQLAAIAATPSWLPLVGAWERLWTLPVHVALSVVVLQVFRRGSVRWLWLAIAAHGLMNFVAIGTPLLLGLRGLSATVVPEVIITTVGLLALWVIFRLRDPLPREGATPGSPGTGWQHPPTLREPSSPAPESYPRPKQPHPDDPAAFGPPTDPA